MIKTEQKLGLSGEFQVIVRRADGSIKFDTGMQPNLVLDNGIKHYLGLPMVNSAGKQQTEHKNGFMRYCYVGTGNKQPAIGDVALQNMVARHVTVRDSTHGTEQPDTGLHEGFVKLWKRGKYVFDNINNQNITEVGLATWYGDEVIDTVTYKNVYTLVTRALIKDSRGIPITVTVLQGEVLEVVYQINMYVDIKRQTGSFTLTTTKDNQDTVETFDYFMQPYGIAIAAYIDNWLHFDGYYQGITSWGVKETDDQLTADYDLNDEAYQNITHLNTTSFDTKITGRSSSNRASDKYSNSYLLTTETERSFETRRVSYKHVNGIYTHIYPNGIRAYKVGVGYTYHDLVQGLVVVKNRANGQGIKKTNRLLWEFSHSFTINRWEG